MRVERASAHYLTAWAEMRADLWIDTCGHCLTAEAREWLGDERAGRPVWLAIERDEAVGFVEAALRHDYVNGCDASPVAFLEGLYVAPGHRRRGVARALVQAVADWAQAQGIREFASDGLLTNEDSHVVHRALGFVETERVVYFRRTLAR